MALVLLFRFSCMACLQVSPMLPAGAASWQNHLVPGIF